MGSGAAKVTFTEQDLSFFISSVTEGKNCIQITARKGPINDPQLIGSMKQFREVYGLGLTSSNSDIVCQRALDRGARLYINRVAHYSDPADATTLTAVLAEITLKNSAGTDTLKLTAKSEGSWGNTVLITISANAADDQRFDITIEFPEQPDMNEEFTALTMNEDDERYAVSSLNEQSKLVDAEDLDSGDPFEDDVVTVDSDDFTAGTDFPIDIENINTMAATLAEKIDETSTTVTASSTSNVVTVTAVTAGTSGNSISLEVDSDGDNITVSGSTLSGGAAAVAATGTITYGSPSNGDTVVIDGTTFTKVASGPAANEFTTIAELNTLISALSSVNSSSDGSVITVTAATAGAAGNSITMSKTGSALTLSGATLGAGAGVDGADAVAATGTITFASDPIVVDNPAPIGPIAMADGNDGLSGSDDDDWIGDSATSTGLHAFDNIDDAFGLGSPEASSPEVVAAGIAYCENRADMVYICEPDSSVIDANTAIDFRNGTGDYDHAAFNSSFGAMYFGRPKIRSSRTSSIIDIPNIGDVFGVHAYSDAKSEVWYAPAGLQRGKVPNTLGVHYNVGTPARASELDDLSDNQLNAIVNFSEDGTVIWEELTLQRLPSALQSLHVRRLLIYMRKALLKINRIFLFEPNDPKTWRRVYNMIDPFMADLLSRRAFYEYQIQCDQDAKNIDDAILNTAERIDRGEFVCRIYIKPTRTLKYFALQAVITKSTANFTELLDLRI